MGAQAFQAAMNPEQVKKALVDAVQTTFAEMAFIDVIETEPKEVEYKQIESVEISEPFRGSLLVKLPIAVKRNIVEYIHADDWNNLQPDKIDDCLLELLNVLGGNFLYNLFGEDIKYKILFPEMIFDESDLPDISPEISLYFDAEGQYFSVDYIQEHL